MKAKPITIKTAKEIAQLGYDEVIIVGCQYETGIQHVTTYGKSLAACENAAIGGNAVKKLLGWPEDKCNAKPARQKKKEAKVWSDEDMIRYGSMCYLSKDDNEAFSDLLNRYKETNKEK